MCRWGLELMAFCAFPLEAKWSRMRGGVVIFEDSGFPSSYCIVSQDILSRQLFQPLYPSLPSSKFYLNMSTFEMASPYSVFIIPD